MQGGHTKDIGGIDGGCGRGLRRWLNGVGTGDVPEGGGQFPRARQPFPGGNAHVLDAKAFRPEGTSPFFGAEKSSACAKNSLNEVENFLNDVRNVFSDVGNLLHDDGNSITVDGNFLNDDRNSSTDDGNILSDNGNFSTDVRILLNDVGNSPTDVRNSMTGARPSCRIAAP